MGKSLVLAFVGAVLAISIGDAAAGTCRDRDRDNPMVASGSFGIATCATRGARYHSRDHSGEGARGYARRNASDPMVWSDARWRSSLMGGYARDYDNRYDRRFRRAGAGGSRIVRSIAQVIVTNAPGAAVASEAARPTHAKAFRVRGRETDVMENRAGFAGHRCPGILVLTWGAAGSKARCFNDQGRIRTPH